MAPPVRRSKHPITAYYSIYRPRKDERLSRPGWLITYRNKVPPPGVEPGHVTHPSTNRARRRVTLLIRPTPLPPPTVLPPGELRCICSALQTTPTDDDRHHRPLLAWAAEVSQKRGGTKERGQMAESRSPKGRGG